MKTILTFLILASISSHAFSSQWYKLESEFSFPKITETELENLIWKEMSKMDENGAFPRSQYSYQYSMRDADTLFVLGFCKLSDFFDGVDLTKKGIGISDGGLTPNESENRYFKYYKPVAKMT